MPDNETKNPIDDSKLKERFSRWQDKLNNQFGFYNNLLTGLSVGSIAFLVNMLFQDLV